MRHLSGRILAVGLVVAGSAWSAASRTSTGSVKPAPKLSLKTVPLSRSSTGRSAPRPDPWTASIGPSRTGTGRPADLDPRIAWLDDLGLPQSGGPEPLVPLTRYPIPRGADVESLVSLGDSIAYLGQVERNRDAGELPVLVLTCRRLIDGVSWSRTLPTGLGYLLVAENKNLYVVPGGTSPMFPAHARPEIIGFDQNGREIGRWSWQQILDAQTRFPNGLGRIRLAIHDGTIAGEISGGYQGKLVARVKPSSTANPDDFLTLDDLIAEYSDDNVKQGLVKLKVQDPDFNHPDGAEIHARRVHRTKALAGRHLRVDNLPWFRPDLPDVDHPAHSYLNLNAELVQIGPNGEIVLDVSIMNPHNLSWAILDDKAIKAERGRGAYAFYDKHDKLRCWVILPPEVGGIPVGDELYVRSPNGDYIERWVHIK